MKELNKDNLDSKHRDKATSLGKAVVGAIPFAGPLLTEVMTAVVPGLKEERLIEYVRILNTRIDALEAIQKERVRTNPHHLEFIEEGALQAMRATSSSRIEHIAELVAKGLERDEALDIRRKRLLRLLSQIDDDEVLILNAYGHSSVLGRKSTDVQETPWAKVERPERLTMSSKVTREKLEAQPLYDMGVENLRSLGLLLLKPRRVRKGEQIQFDIKTGEPIGSIIITRLGYMLLDEIGLLSDDHHYLRN